MAGGVEKVSGEHVASILRHKLPNHDNDDDDDNNNNNNNNNDDDDDQKQHNSVHTFKLRRTDGGWC
jgi:hypothetical protein